MIYVGIIVAICAAEFWIRRRVNKNFATNEKREAGRLPICLRKYHNEGMANNTLEKKPQLVKGIGIGIISILTIMFLLAMTLKGKKCFKNGSGTDPWWWSCQSAGTFSTWICDGLCTV